MDYASNQKNDLTISSGSVRETEGYERERERERECGQSEQVL